MNDTDKLNYQLPLIAAPGSTILQCILRTFIGVVLGTAITFPTMLLALRSVSDHHPGELTAILLFPFSMILVGLNSPPHFSSNAITIAVAQYPLYGAILGSISRHRYFWIGAAALILVHIGAAALCVSRILDY